MESVLRKVQVRWATGRTELEVRKPLLTRRGQENKVSGISLQREFSLQEKQSHDSHHQIQRGSCGRDFESPVFGAPRGRAEEKRQKLQRGSICPNIRNFLTIHCSTLAKNWPLLRPLMTLRGKETPCRAFCESQAIHPGLSYSRDSFTPRVLDAVVI